MIDVLLINLKPFQYVFMRKNLKATSDGYETLRVTFSNALH